MHSGAPLGLAPGWLGRQVWGDPALVPAVCDGWYSAWEWAFLSRPMWLSTIPSSNVAQSATIAPYWLLLALCFISSLFQTWVGKRNVLYWRPSLWSQKKRQLGSSKHPSAIRRLNSAVLSVKYPTENSSKVQKGACVSIFMAEVKNWYLSTS